MKLKARVAIITGAGTGLGRACAILFAKEGAKVVVACRTVSTGEETVGLIRRAGGEASFVKTDVAVADDVKKMIKTAMDNYDGLDIMLNNAGIVQQPTYVEETDEADWDRVIAVNLKGVFLGCKYAVPIMKRQGGGVIINMSSINATYPFFFHTAYPASKAGVVAMTKALAQELGDYNIRVNCISPGGILTEIYQTFPNSEAFRKDFTRIHRLGRLGKPEEIAYAALYLASDEASFTTGHNFVIDGGATAGIPFDLLRRNR